MGYRVNKFIWVSRIYAKSDYLIKMHLSTGCGSHFRNPAPFNILKKPLLVQKQTIHEQKALDFSFHLVPWKWAWHYQEGVTPFRREITFFTPRAPMLFAAGGRGRLMIMPRPLLGCQIKLRSRAFYWCLVCFCTINGLVLSEYWKRLEENFRKKIISVIS